MSREDHCEMLWDHLDGTLSAAGESAFRHHVDRCPTCTVELAQHRSIAGALRDRGDEEPPPSIRVALRAELRRIHGPRQNAPRILRWALPVPAWAAAALLALGVLVGAWLVPRGGPVEAPPVDRTTTVDAPVALTYSVYQADGSVKTVSRLASTAGAQGDDAPKGR